MMNEGKLYFKDDVTEGLENAPLALKKLFTGLNTGKTMVKIGDDKATPKL